MRVSNAFVRTITLRDPGLSRKTQRKISFKMSVLRPSETVWGPSYEGFSVYTLFLMSSSWYHNENIMMITSWGSFWGHFEWILEVFWEDFWTILGSCSLQKSSWKLSQSFVEAGSRFSEFDSDHFGGFWRAFGNHFRDILESFVDINVIMDFDMIFRWFFIDLHTLQTSKSEQITWEVLQKPNFRLVCYRMCLEIDFGRILGSGRKQFWVPIGLQKRLRKQVL